MQDVAAIINTARTTGVSCSAAEHKAAFDSVRSLDDITEVHKHLLASNPQTRVGWKVGMNNPEGGFSKIGLSEPFTAPLMANNIVENGAEVTVPFLTQGAGVAEAEWAFTLGRDVTPKADGTMFSIEETVQQIETMGIAIELVAPCMKGEASWFAKIADYGLCSAVVFQPLFDPRSVLVESPNVLASKQVWLSVGPKKKEGPFTLDGVQELNRTIRLLLAKGCALKKGDILITGAVAKIMGTAPGDEVKATFDHPAGGVERVTVSCRIGKDTSSHL